MESKAECVQLNLARKKNIKRTKTNASVHIVIFHWK